MNDFEWGVNYGRFFASLIVNDDFFGIAIRIGKEYASDVDVAVNHITIQIGFFQITIGITDE